MMKRKSKCMILLLILTLLSGVIMSVPVRAEGTRRTIRVAYSEDADLINKSSSGIYKGYIVEYLNKISQYTGWKYEYINEPWQKQLDDLKNGNVDLICNAQKTAEREKDYDFSSIPIGTEQSILYTDPDNEDIYYQDYEHMAGKVVGLLEGSYQNKEFQQRKAVKNILCTERYYGTEEKLIEALKRKEVDMTLMGSVSKHGSLKVVDKFGNSSMYIITTKGNTEILNALNDALDHLQSEAPNLAQQLSEEYFSTKNQNSMPLFTREEAKYVQKFDRAVRIGCVSGIPPMSYQDEDTGKLNGIYIALLNKISEKSGMSFEIEAISENVDYKEAMKSGKYDFIAGVPFNQEVIDDQDVALTDEFFKREYYMVSRRGEDVTELGKPVVVLEEQFKKYKSMMPDLDEGNSYIYKKDPEEILNAVENGSADIAVLGTYAAAYYLQMSKYQNLSMTGMPFSQTEICMMYQKQADKNLISVINKSIGCISESDQKEVIRHYAAAQNYQFSMAEFLRRYQYQILCITLVILMLVLFALISNRRKVDRQIQAAAQEAYRKRVETDGLTGLMNKEGFYRTGEEYLEKHNSQEVRLVYLNIENFKLVNDLFGVKAGDELLQFTGHELKKICDSTGSICSRYEADHFVVLTTENTDAIEEEVDIFYDRIRQYHLNISVEISAGVYLIKDRNKSFRIMCDRAHLAAESIKKNHMTHVAVYDDTHRQKLIQEQMILGEMEKAIKEKQFKAYFQPKYDMRNDHIIGAEALVRWEHPEKGLLSPGVFIPILEKNGFISKLDLYIYEETCSFLKECMDTGMPLYPISVNLSRVGFYNPDLFDILCEIADRYHVPRKYLELEITETAYTSDSKSIFAVLEQLRKGGFHILMDDFGSGYSSLNMLKEAPIDEIKLDMRFLSADDPYGRAENILHMIIAMGNSMRLSVLAEGVETEKQKKMLQSFCCNKAQGYYYARPMKAQNYMELLKKEKNDK